ncbi:unnamed protein product [Brassica napus]|nr:unnamed protein product [Brassica napus]
MVQRPNGKDVKSVVARLEPGWRAVQLYLLYHQDAGHFRDMIFSAADVADHQFICLLVLVQGEEVEGDHRPTLVPQAPSSLKAPMTILRSRIPKR